MYYGSFVRSKIWGIRPEIWRFQKITMTSSMQSICQRQLNKSKDMESEISVLIHRQK
jgi:hypothetical protein